MKPEDLEEALRAGGISLTMDTNVVSGGGNHFRQYSKIVQGVKNLNAKFELEHPHRTPVKMRVSALVHVEVLFDLRQTHGSDFDASKASSGLANTGLLVRDFDLRAAETCARVLGGWFPTSGEWAAEKRARLVRAMGLEPKDPQPSRSRHFPATVDSFIAAQAEGDDDILITNDKGSEFDRVKRKVDVETLEKALQALLSDQDRASRAG